MSSTLKTSLENDWHTQMYNRYLHGDPSNRHREFKAPSGMNYPIQIDSGHHVYVGLKRYADGVTGSYNVAYIPPRTGNLRELQRCVDKTGNPYRCANIPQ